MPALEGTSFIWHLDTPTLEPTHLVCEVRGWIAGAEPARDITLGAKPPIALPMEERPDVSAAYPQLPYSVGFRATVPARFVKGAIAIEFKSNGGSHRFISPLLRSSKAGRALFFSQLKAWKARWGGYAASCYFLPRFLRYRLAQGALFDELVAKHGSFIHRDQISGMLATLARFYPRAAVLQIGANDGKTGDPLFELIQANPWSGVLVEPLIAPFTQLRERHRENSRIKVANVAVSDRSGWLPLFRLVDTGGADSSWCLQLSTFNREVLEKHRTLIADLDQRIVEEKVRSVTLGELISEYQVEAIDLFACDTEGHDARILKQFRFDIYRPKLVIFEHQHLSPGELSECRVLLDCHGYNVFLTDQGDAFAWPRL